MEKQELEAIIETTWNQLLTLWTSFGHGEESIKKRKQTVIKHAKIMFDEMVSEEERKTTEKKETIRLTVHEIIQLSSDLGIEPTVKGYTETSRKTLLEQEVELNDAVEILRAQKKIRMAKYEFLRDQEKVLCEELDEQISVIPFTGIPHDNQVAELEGIVRHWNQEKVRRTKVIEELQSDIVSTFSALEKLPGNTIERLAAGPCPQLSSKNISDFEKLLASLQAQLRANEQEADDLWKKITELWKRLKFDEEYTSAFENAMVGFKPSIIAGLKKELHRLEEEKRKNMQSFTIEIRSELIELYRICYVSVEEQQAFTEMHSTDFTEELLEIHESEILKWKTFLDKHTKIINAISRRQEVWVKWLELEAIEDDPGRLANRGGALLKHEKEKKLTKKVLDKSESEIKKLDGDFVKEYGRNFTVWGKPILELIEEEKLVAADEKQERKNNRKKQVEESNALTPAGSRKRGLPPTPGGTKHTPLAKRGKPTLGMTLVRTPGQKPTLKGRAVPAAANNDRTRYNFRKAEGGEVDLVSPASTYSEFTNHLLKTNGLSSSVCQPLTAQNGQHRLAGPMSARKASPAPLKMTAVAKCQLQNQF